MLPPDDRHENNVFLSLVDAVASGKPLITGRRAGLARLERDGVPAVFYDKSAADLFRQVDDILQREPRRKEIATRSIAFAKEKLDVYHILERILEEQIL